MNYRRLSIGIFVFTVSFLLLSCGSVVASSDNFLHSDLEQVEEVSLITGEKVLVGENDDGKITVNLEDAEGSYNKVVNDSGVYIFPEEYDRDLYEKELFNVVKLAEYTEDGENSIVFEYNQNTLSNMESNSNINVKNYISDINIASAKVTKDGLSEDQVKSMGIEKIWLDRELNVDLYESVGEINVPDNIKSRNLTGEGVDVAVLDTGVDSDHPDLQSSVVYQENFVSGENTTKDLYSHGTPVAGIIAGDGVENESLVGVAPDANIYDMRVLGSDGSGSLSDVINGLNTAIEKDVDIISMSLGSDLPPNNPLNSVVNKANNQGIVVITSAGNSGSEYNSIESPGNAKGAIAVGADDTLGRSTQGDIAVFSSRGPSSEIGFRMKPAVTAPGVKIKSANSLDANSNEYVTYSGTSFSAPHVSGVVALMIENNPSITPEQVRSDLVTGADDINGNRFSMGGGQVNLSSAINPEIRVDDPQIGFDFNKDQFESNITKSFNITNLRDNKTDFNLSISLTHISQNQKGNASLDPRSVMIKPNRTKQVNITITSNSKEPGLYEGTVNITRSGNKIGNVIFGYKQPIDPDDLIQIKLETRDNRSPKGESVYLKKYVGEYSTTLSFNETGSTFFAPQDEGTYVLFYRSFMSDFGDGIIIRKVIENTTNTNFVKINESKAKRYSIDSSSIEDKRGKLLTRFSEARIVQGNPNTSAYYQSYGLATVGLHEDPNIYLYGDNSNLTSDAQYEFNEILVPESTHKKVDGGGIQNKFVYNGFAYTNGFNGKYTESISENNMRELDSKYLRDNRDLVLVSERARPSTLEVFHTFEANTSLGWNAPIIKTTSRQIGNRYNQEYYYNVDGMVSQFGVRFDYLNTEYELEKGSYYRQMLKPVSNPNPIEINPIFNDRPYTSDTQVLINKSKISYSGNLYTAYTNTSSEKSKIQFRGYRGINFNNSYKIYVNNNKLYERSGFKNSFNTELKHNIKESDTINIKTKANILDFSRYTAEYSINYQPDEVNKPPKINSIDSPDKNNNNTIIYNQDEGATLYINIKSHTSKGLQDVTVSYMTENNNKWQDADITNTGNEEYRVQLADIPSGSRNLSLRVNATDVLGSSVKFEMHQQDFLLEQSPVNIKGKLLDKNQNNPDPITGVNIDVIGNGKILDTIKTDKSGKFSFSIYQNKLNKTYKLRINSQRVSNVTKTVNSDSKITINTTRLRPAPVSEMFNQPNDPNGDGLYEDINGDGVLSFADIQALFINQNSNFVEYNTQFYAFSSLNEEDKNLVDLFDIYALYEEIKSIY